MPLLCFFLLLKVLVPFLVMFQVPFPVLVSDQTWFRSLVPVPSYFWSRPWSQSRSSHISGPVLGPGTGHNFWSRHRVTIWTIYGLYMEYICTIWTIYLLCKLTIWTMFRLYMDYMDYVCVQDSHMLGGGIYG